MKQVKTARGKTIDMGALAKAHEEERAVSNVAMNARGDRLDESGQVVATVQKIARAQHMAATPVEKKPLSKATEETPKRPKRKSAPKEVGRVNKTREDGSEYVEIEFDDGSMKTEEVSK